CLLHLSPLYSLALFFFNEPATTKIYTLSLHDALPIFRLLKLQREANQRGAGGEPSARSSKLCTLRSAVRIRVSRWPSSRGRVLKDRKSTRLNSSHVAISYAVFCLKKKKSEIRIEVAET